MKTFLHESDYDAYIDLMAEWRDRHGVKVWAYCLMPNHVHLVCVPEAEDSLARAVGEAHRRYARMVTFREGWRGRLFQERFASFPMDERHTYFAARYVEMNPVRARLARRPRERKHSSARAHLAGKDDRLVDAAALLGAVDDWAAYLAESEEAWDLIRRHERSGRPLGSSAFAAELERATGRTLARRRPGPRRGG